MNAKTPDPHDPAGSRALRQAGKPAATTPAATTPAATPPGSAKPAALAESPSSLTAGFHFRGRLPHLKREGAAYFVTFRLADSLPATEVLRLKREREALLADALAHKRPLTWHEQQQLLAWYSEKVDRLLDAGHGACWLQRPDLGEMVAGALKG